MKKLLLVLVPLALVGAGVAYWLWHHQSGQRPTFRTQAVERGPFLAAISASGTIEPLEAIDVGAQVAGRIERFGVDPRSSADMQAAAAVDCLLRLVAATPLWTGLVPVKTIDYRSPVEAGTILAQLDASLYKAEVDSTRAELALARAELLQLQAKLEQATREWARAKELHLSKSIPQAEYDLARSNHEVAQANILRGQANVEKAETNARKAEINLNYTTIRSPVKGVIVDRRVNVGQTVVASLNAPSLFLIATDLKKLQVWAAVNEADIGQIKPGQEVRFTVDAYPNELFFGQVAEDQPRLNASMTQNVVTYTVVVNIDNSDLKLLPYLTANLKFVQTHKSSALLLPNSALRWRPHPALVVPEHRAEFEKSLKQRKTNAAERGLGPEKDANVRLVWVSVDGLVRPVRVHLGLSDGTMTEVLGGELNEGDLIVTGEESRTESGAGNPFTPNVFGGGKKRD